MPGETTETDVYEAGAAAAREELISEAQALNADPAESPKDPEADQTDQDEVDASEADAAEETGNDAETPGGDAEASEGNDTDADAEEDQADAPEVAEGVLAAVDSLLAAGVGRETLDSLSDADMLALASKLAAPGETGDAAEDAGGDAAAETQKNADADQADPLSSVFAAEEATALRAEINRGNEAVAVAVSEAVGQRIGEMRTAMVALSKFVGPLLREQMRPAIAETYPEVDDAKTWNSVQARAQKLIEKPEFAEDPARALEHAAYLETYSARRLARDTKQTKVDRARRSGSPNSGKKREGVKVVSSSADLLARNAAIAAGTDTSSQQGRERAANAMQSNRRSLAG